MSYVNKNILRVYLTVKLPPNLNAEYNNDNEPNEKTTHDRLSIMTDTSMNNKGRMKWQQSSEMTQLFVYKQMSHFRALLPLHSS